MKARERIRVYAVNPRYDDIMGVKSYATVSDLPEAPDVVGIVVPYNQVMEVLQDSHRKGAGSAIVISAGFSERDEEDRRIYRRNSVPLPVNQDYASVARISGSGQCQR